jgi:arylsulfatase A-like enzyme
VNGKNEGLHAKFWAFIRYLDHLPGKVMDHLDKLGIRDNTIIVWTTDNGIDPNVFNKCHGRLVGGQKQKTTEPGVNVPFIVNCPGLVPQGKRSEALVDLTDMAPTFADFAGAKLPKAHVFDGVSQKEIFLGTNEKLIDLKEDPREEKNLKGNPGYKDV